MSGLIDALDGALAEVGEDITLRRIAARGINVDCEIRALARAFRQEELVGGLDQTDSLVIISPTDIKKAQWPGGTIPVPPPYNEPAWMPRSNDKVIVQGRIRNVALVKPMAVGGEIVRIELTIKG